MQTNHQANNDTAIAGTFQPYTMQQKAENWPAISPMKLAKLDIGIFQTLFRLGTGRDRICGVLDISPGEYRYLQELVRPEL